MDATINTKDSTITVHGVTYTAEEWAQKQAEEQKVQTGELIEARRKMAALWHHKVGLEADRARINEALKGINDQVEAFTQKVGKFLAYNGKDQEVVVYGMNRQTDSLDTWALAEKANNTGAEVTAGDLTVAYIAALVEQGHLTARDIEECITTDTKWRVRTKKPTKAEREELGAQW